MNQPDPIYPQLFLTVHIKSSALSLLPICTSSEMAIFTWKMPKVLSINFPIYIFMCYEGFCTENSYTIDQNQNDL